MASSNSPYGKTVSEILNGLAKVRLEQNAWVDSESEEAGRETQVFKIGECLYAFYLVAKEGSFEGDLPVPPEVLLEDTKLFFRYITKDGFFPSPYSQIPKAVDQYTDLAAFALVFSTLVHDYWANDEKHERQLGNAPKTVARKALDFLVNPQHHLRDKEAGSRWAGTSRCKRSGTKGGEEFYTSAFFTSVVASGLARSLEHPLLGLSTAEKDDVRNLIRDAGKWVIGRFDNEFITGDEQRSNRSLINSTWGLRMLLETSGIQEQNVRNMLKPIANAYVQSVGDRIKRTGSLVQQEYLTVFSDDVSAPLYYEDRSGIGGILITLALLGRYPDLEDILDKIGFTVIFEQALNSIMLLRSVPTGLWYSYGLILSINTYLVEAFLILSRRGWEAGKKLEVSGYMVRAAVREVLTDDVTLTNLEQTIYQRLLKMAESSERERRLEGDIAHLSASAKESRRPEGGLPSSKVTRGNSGRSRRQKGPPA